MAIIQARMQSTRCPNKVLLPLCGKPILWHIVQRVQAVVPEVVVATGYDISNEPLFTFCQREGIHVSPGSNDDVLSRYYWAAWTDGAERIVRLTGDNPCVMPDLIQAVLAMQEQGYDLVGTATGGGAYGIEGNHFPDGVDVECFTFQALKEWTNCALLPERREHVSLFAWCHPDQYHIGRIFAPVELGDHRWTVDHLEDYALVTAIYEALWTPARHFTMDEVLAFLDARPDVYALNRKHVGQEGYAALWQEHHA